MFWTFYEALFILLLQSMSMKLASGKTHYKLQADLVGSCGYRAAYSKKMFR